MTSQKVAIAVRKGEKLMKTTFFDCLSNIMDGNLVDITEDINAAIVLLTPAKNKTNGIELFHAPNCPIRLLTDADISHLSTQHGLAKTIFAAAGTIVESRDGFILLTQRSAAMKAFPSHWVVPGGYVDAGELQEQSAVREVKEETGVDLNESVCIRPLKPLMLWESVFPPDKNLALPKRYALVTYFHAKLTVDYETVSQFVISPNEVSRVAWVSKVNLVCLLTKSKSNMQVPSFEPVSEGSSIVHSVHKSLAELFPDKDLITSGTWKALEQIL